MAKKYVKVTGLNKVFDINADGKSLNTTTLKSGVAEIANDYSILYIVANSSDASYGYKEGDTFTWSRGILVGTNKQSDSIVDVSINGTTLTYKTSAATNSSNNILNPTFNYYTTDGSAGDSNHRSTKLFCNIANNYTLTNGVPADGTTLAIRLKAAGVGTYGILLSVDNGTTYKPVVYNVNTVVSSRYAADSTIVVTYNATRAASGYPTSSTTATTITGCWQICDYDTTNVYQLKDNNSLLYADSVIYRYLLLATTPAGKYTPFNNENNITDATKSLLTNVDIDPFKPIKYYSSTTTKAKDESVGAAYEHVACTVQYSFNVATGSLLTAYKPVYIAFIPLSNGSVRLAPNTSTLVKPWPLTLDLPTTEDGYVYKYIGDAYSTTNIELMVDLPLYYFKDDEIRLWDNDADNSTSVSYTQTSSSTAAGAYEIGKITVDGTETTIYGIDTNTDTKVTSTTGDTKAYLLGHTTAAETSTALTNASVYMQSGKLYSNNAEVITGSLTSSKSDITSTGTKIVRAQDIQKYIADTYLNAGVQYLGTVASTAGLIKTDPSVGKGDFYRVSTEFQISNETAHVGDIVLAINDKPTTVTSADWDILHTEQNSNTWRAIKVNGTQQIANTADTALDLSAGPNVTLSYENNKVLISAANTKVTSAANHYGYTANSGGFKGSGTATWGSTIITGLTLDDAKHVINVSTNTLPANPNTDAKVTNSIASSETAYYVLGLPTQGSNGQAYTSGNVYIKDNYLYVNGCTVNTGETIQFNDAISGAYSISDELNANAVSFANVIVQDELTNAMAFAGIREKIGADNLLNWTSTTFTSYYGNSATIQDAFVQLANEAATHIDTVNTTGTVIINNVAEGDIYHLAVSKATDGAQPSYNVTNTIKSLYIDEKGLNANAIITNAIDVVNENNNETSVIISDLGITSVYDCLQLYSETNDVKLIAATSVTVYAQSLIPDESDIQLGTEVSPWGDIHSEGIAYADRFLENSDARLKDIKREIDLDKAYDLIEKCSTIIYTLKDDESNTELIGVLAQEIREFFPEIVVEKENGFLTVEYSRLTVIIMRVLKDLIDRIKKLESK